MMPLMTTKTTTMVGAVRAVHGSGGGYTGSPSRFSVQRWDGKRWVTIESGLPHYTAACERAAALRKLESDRRNVALFFAGAKP